MINFGSLAEGEHEFEYRIDDSFFQKFEHSPVQNGDVDVLVVVEKKDNMLLLDFTMEGALILACDRCLEDLELEMESFNELIVKFGDVKEEQEVSEDVLILPAKENELDISRFIYEYITLSDSDAKCTRRRKRKSFLRSGGTERTWETRIEYRGRTSYRSSLGYFKKH